MAENGRRILKSGRLTIIRDQAFNATFEVSSKLRLHRRQQKKRENGDAVRQDMQCEKSVGKFVESIGIDDIVAMITTSGDQPFVVLDHMVKCGDPYRRGVYTPHSYLSSSPSTRALVK